MWWIIVAVVTVGAIAWGLMPRNVEQAKYEVVESQDQIQIRDYAAMMVAETEVSGNRKAAINQGFRVIADYIFGNNTRKENVAMTAPVTQEGAGGRWTVRFVMPAGYTIDKMPRPNNAAVKLQELPSKRFAVIRFSGMAGEASLKERLEELNGFIRDKKLKALSAPTYAFFDPPWTPPFLRRNEIMIEIAVE